MQTSARKTLSASKEQIWAIVTDIEKAAERISCIKEIEILERPSTGFVGLKWKETRVMFGKEAVETMWIKEAKENEYYVTEAINSGCVYHSTIALQPNENGVELIMSFRSTPQSFFAKLMAPMMLMMKGMIKKAFMQDIEDIEKALQSA